LSPKAWAWLIGLLIVWGLAASHPTAFGLVVLATVIGVAVFWWRRVQGRRRLNAQVVADLDEEERWWRETPIAAGAYSVLVTAVTAGNSGVVWAFLDNASENETIEMDDADSVLQRVAHIGPQIVLADVHEDVAIAMKIALEDRGAKVKIREGTQRVTSGARAPIPERVRHEVWRRDGGACVDCGSRERLEYDHIVPVSRGGANTARNIELRCEPCNRKKGAKV
jgi:hypothetical protein